MRVGLFIPCYVDQFYPRVGMATVRVLEDLGVDVRYPADQTCCGQPMANAGCETEVGPLARKFLDLFRDDPYVVCPSGSCVSMVRHHYDEHLRGMAGLEHLKEKTYELCEFLVDVLGVESIDRPFPYRVGLHASCHGLRQLRLAGSSELVSQSPDKPRQLLASLEGIELTELRRRDECCGFGGMFSVGEEAVSVMMGRDRLDDHQQAGTQIITAVDMSCLMHLSGLVRRENRPIRVMHIAEILAGDPVPDGVPSRAAS